MEPAQKDLIKAAVRELKSCVRQGACKLAPGNVIHWTPEELASMTPEERERCVPKGERGEHEPADFS